MIAVDCAICHHELDRPGAIVVSPPDEHGNAKKSHVCMPCWQKGPTMESIIAAVQVTRCRECGEAVAWSDGEWREANSGSIGCLARIGFPPSSGGHQP